jgi:hypothetical protein
MEDNSVFENTIRTMEGYVEHGASYWPTADVFLLAGIGKDGDLDGSGVDICRGCVTEVATQVIDFLSCGRFPKEGALAICGKSYAYDILGESYSDHQTCANCGEAV